MHISEKTAYREFQSNRVQSALRELEQRFNTQVTATELMDWGTQGIIVCLECPVFNFKVCVKIRHSCNRPLLKKKPTVMSEAQVNKVLTNIGAECVPRLLYYSEDGTYLAREYIEGDTLYKEIKNATIEERINLAYLEWDVMSKAFKLFHENEVQPYVIWDLRAQNMILSPLKDAIFLIDFGSCRRKDDLISKQRWKGKKMLGGNRHVTRPLEQLILDKNSCSHKVDYFAFGVLLFETIFNRKPYSNTERIISRAKQKYENEYLMAKHTINDAVGNNSLPTDLAELMIHTLQPEPEKRLMIFRH